jgi:FtsP/CotA-like multicopper oxidase with cupredoxin domain
MNKKFNFPKTLLIAGAVLLLTFSLAHAGPGGGTWYANSPAGGVTGTALSKFVDSLPGLGLPGCNPSFPTGGGFSCNANNLGQYIPVANADTATFTGSDYYEIGLMDHQEQMHSNLPGTGYGTGTKIRGYYQINNGNALGGTTDHSKHYLGPLIIATKDRPVRIKFVNNLGINGSGNLFLPVDTTVMGAGVGPTGAIYTQNRATLHLHGGHSPWISDGTPHQWITPALDATPYKKGDSFQNVPDMVGEDKPIEEPALGDGLATFFWTNQQSGRLMFYHDHAYGITRLNVYAGEAAGYLIVDQQELDLIHNRTIPNICAGSDGNPDILCQYKFGIPLVIQDKTFVPANVATQDTLWDVANWGGQGNLWFPHVYEPNQDPNGGLTPMGRWDWGPYVWPPSPVTNPVLPTLSTVPEAFNDTPIVNGTAYPYLPVEAKVYRFRILSAANDRSYNLQLYYGATSPTGTVCNDGLTAYSACKEVKMIAAPDGRDGGIPDPTTAGPSMIQIGSESGFLPAPVTLANTPIGFDGVGNVADKTLLLMPAERADVLIDFTGVTPGSTIILYNDAPAALPGGDPRYDYYTGNADQTASGGAPPTVAGFGPNTRTIMQFRVVAATAPITTVNTGTLPAALLTAYTASQPAHIVPADQYAKLIDTSMTINGVVMPFKGKSINEGFDSTYGRINAMLGTEEPNGLTPPVPLEYIAPATEIVANDQVQLWKITHNGVDSHPIHFHLTDVQVVNRIGWDGSINPPDPSEMGWKETVRMNPLETIIVAMRPTEPQLPFTIPNSIRRLDVTQPVSATNPLTNFGHEYVWHCHILGHEEFDLMRPLVLNPNAKTDILWRDSSTGANVVWFMDGVTVARSNDLPSISNTNWTIVGTGDFNNDTKPDILWRNTSTGENVVWFMDGTTVSGAASLNTVANTLWTIAGTGDFNNDTKTDILWRNTSTGQNVIWYMNGVTVSGSNDLPAISNTNWTIAGTGDFNSDSKPDILWRNTSTGDNVVWYMDGITVSGADNVPTNTNLDWQIVGIGDFNSDVKPDILWRNITTGENMVWYMNGVTNTGTAVLQSVSNTNWKIVGK